jgi:hypothetical protein
VFRNEFGVLMKIKPNILFVLILSLLASALAGCTAETPAASPLAAETFTDPFAYCSSVGTIDAPDDRYTGEKIPEAMIKGYLKSAGIPENPAYTETYKTMTIWRCMGKKVMVCNFGANLPCDAKANTSKEPSPGMADYCKANPEVDFIPMAVTGHETIYSWRCNQGVPTLLDQIAHVDASGYLQEIWYPVEPVP